MSVCISTSCLRRACRSVIAVKWTWYEISRANKNTLNELSLLSLWIDWCSVVQEAVSFRADKLHVHTSVYAYIIICSVNEVSLFET